MGVQLVSRFGTWKLPDGDLVMGRHSRADLHIDDIRLSRRHAEFRIHGTTVELKDLGSINGVLVNGERLSGSTRLKHGDVVVVGPIAFKVEIDVASASHERIERPGYVKQTTQLEFKPSTETGLRRTANMAPDELVALARNEQLDHRETMPAMDSMPPPPTAALQVPDRAEELKRTKSTDQLLPAKRAQMRTEALAPKDPREALLAELRSIRGRRLLAGVLDPFCALLTGLLVALLLVGIGCLWALHQAQAGLHEGTLVLGSDAPAGPAVLAAALCDPVVLGELPGLLGRMHGEHRQAFLIFFVASTLGLLALVLILLFWLVAATMLHGAPFWHRRLGLAIREQRNGYFPTALRSLLRWSLVALLGVTAPIAILAGRRAPHDLLSGCRVTRPDFSSDPG